MPKITEHDGYLKDDRGNTAYLDYFGSEEAARKALESLEDCDNCRNCSRCSDCSGCSGCSRCSDCSDCSGCSGCSRCSDCSDCSDCSGCSRCSDCSDCSGCSGCSGCSRCSDCSDCSGCSRCSDCSDCSGCSGCSGCSRCSDCSDCSDCSGCSRCSHVAYLVDKQDKKGDPDAAPAVINAGAIPKIENIHQTVLAAASQPGALEMGQWHCGTAHCRAGWVVTLAGPAGKALEEFHNTELAAMLIYRESSPIQVYPWRFYQGADEALADMQRCADEEAALPA